MNESDTCKGVQIALISNETDDLQGVQVGLRNVARNKKIHHSIRNEFNNLKYRINNLINTPSLFNNLDLINQDKLELAGMI